MGEARTAFQEELAAAHADHERERQGWEQERQALEAERAPVGGGEGDEADGSDAASRDEGLRLEVAALRKLADERAKPQHSALLAMIDEAQAKCAQELAAITLTPSPLR